MSFAKRCILLLIIFPFLTHGQPMTKPSGEADMASIIGHITLMERSIAQAENRLRMTESKLQAAESEIASLKQDLQQCPDAVEFANLKTWVEALQLSQDDWRKHVNVSDIDSMTASVKSNTKDIDILSSGLLTVVGEISSTTGDLQTTRAKVGELVSKLEDTNQTLHQTVQDIQYRQNITEQALAETETSLQSAQTDVKTAKTQIHTVYGNVTRLGQRVSSLKPNSDVAFQVSQTQNTLAGSTTLHFDKLDYNTGGGYNMTSGMFTAPVPGTYIFWASVRFDSVTEKRHIYIYRGQDPLGNGMAKKSHSNTGVASVLAITDLDKGEKVYFKTDSADDYIDERDSSYGGLLLHAM